MADLKTNYVDDVLDTTKNQLRKYQQIQNDDGTVSFVDVTEYTRVGTSFGAKDINDTNAAINEVNGKLKSKIYSIPIFAKESKTITVELYACAMLLVAGATMYYFCNGYLMPINVNGSVTMGLSSDYKTITVSNTTEASNYFLSIVAFSDISYTIS